MKPISIDGKNGYAIFNGVNITGVHTISYYNFDLLIPNNVLAVKRDTTDKKPKFFQTITNKNVDSVGTGWQNDDTLSIEYKQYKAIMFNLDEVDYDTGISFLNRSCKAAICLDYILKLRQLLSSEDITITGKTTIDAKITKYKDLFTNASITCSIADSSYSGIIAPSSTQYTFKPSLEHGTLQGMILSEL